MNGKFAVFLSRNIALCGRGCSSDFMLMYKISQKIQQHNKVRHLTYSTLKVSGFEHFAHNNFILPPITVSQMLCTE